MCLYTSETFSKPIKVTGWIIYIYIFFFSQQTCNGLAAGVGFSDLSRWLSPKRTNNNKQTAVRCLARRVIKEECRLFYFQRRDKKVTEPEAKHTPGRRRPTHSRRGSGCRRMYTSAVYQPTHSTGTSFPGLLWCNFFRAKLQLKQYFQVE